jgi:serine palmitoyltransferase
VRERMEELASRDRQRFVGNTTTTTCENNETAAASLHVDEGIPPVVAYFVYLSYAVLIFMGHLRDFLALLLRRGRYLRRQTGYPSDNLKVYAPLLKSWENFFMRRLYSRIQDVFNRPIASNPGAIISVLERVSDNGQKSMKVLGSLKNLDSDRQRQEYIYGKYYATTHDGKVARNCLNLGSYNYLGFVDDWAPYVRRSLSASLLERIARDRFVGSQ